MNTLSFLGNGLLKKDKQPKTILKITQAEKQARRAKRSASVEKFLRNILGTRLVQMEKKF